MSHQPLHFGPRPPLPDNAGADTAPRAEDHGVRPLHLDLKRDRALTITWSDGRRSEYPIALLRRLSPAADAKALRESQQHNPLTVLPPSVAAHTGPITAESAELVGRYALRITFSDGHHTGLYAWDYLRQIDPVRPPIHSASPTTPDA